MMQSNRAELVPIDAVETAASVPLRPLDEAMVEVSNYASGRDVVGTTVFVDRPRWTQIWTLECGERLLLLGQGRQLLYWEPSLEPLKTAEGRALDWLIEPVVASS